MACCKVCGDTNQENFYKYQYLCKKHWNQYTYKKSIQKFIDYLNEHRQGIKCEQCGYNKGFWGLAFHHRDPVKKEFSIDRNRGKNIKALKDELDKCDVLCHNCHAEIHAKMRNEL